MKYFLLCCVGIALHSIFPPASAERNGASEDEWFPERVAVFNSDESKEPCNNYAALCDFKYSNISQVCSHNAFSIGTGPAANQRKTLEQQLDDGVRSFMLDLHHSLNDSTVIELCHSYCDLLDGGTLLKTLLVFKDWLEHNPREVVTLFMENSGKFNTLAIVEVFNKADMQKYCYQPREKTNWPTLREMIDSNQRLVVFVDQLYGDAVFSYILPQYQYVWETPFQIYLPMPDWNCNKDRPINGLPSTAIEPMYILNHFVMTNATVGEKVVFSLPSFANTTTINNETLRKHAKNCTELLAKPNFIAVDFYDVGKALDIAAELNGLEPLSSIAKHKSSAISSTSTSPRLLIIPMFLLVGYFCL